MIDQTDRDRVELGHPGNHDPHSEGEFVWLMIVRIADGTARKR